MELANIAAHGIVPDQSVGLGLEGEMGK